MQSVLLCMVVQVQLGNMHLFSLGQPLTSQYVLFIQISIVRLNSCTYLFSIKDPIGWICSWLKERPQY